MEKRLYGVSSGNGNDGVSQMFADYYVMTDEPWRLARLALVGKFKPEYKAQALVAAYIEGEADYTISAMILNPLDEEHDEETGSWSDTNGAWLIIEVFPEDEPRDRPMFDSLEDAFGEEDLKLVPTEG